jgi:hypothetical protein
MGGQSEQLDASIFSGCGGGGAGDGGGEVLMGGGQSEQLDASIFSGWVYTLTVHVIAEVEAISLAEYKTAEAAKAGGI